MVVLQEDNGIFTPPHIIQNIIQIHSNTHIYLLKENAAYLKKIIMDENDALSEYNKIPLGHNRTNGAVFSKIYFKVEIC